MLPIRQLEFVDAQVGVVGASHTRNAWTSGGTALEGELERHETHISRLSAGRSLKSFRLSVQ